MSKIRIAVIVGAAALTLAGGIACGGGTSNPGPAGSEKTTTWTTVTEKPATRPTSQPISLEQQNAVRAAQSYLDMQAFSRKGLISQLSSDAGDGFPAKVATTAVDSLHVDWNAQAVKAARGYLQMQAFSKKGLIGQLESSAGDGFTHDQAVYGVAHSGL